MPAVVADDISASADVAAVGLWATRLRCPQIHQPGRLSDKTSPRYTPEAPTVSADEPNVFCVAVNEITLRYGVPGVKFHYWQTWHSPNSHSHIEPDNELKSGIYGLCDRTNLLDMLRNFVVFDQEQGQTIKKVARWQQFLAANEMVKRALEIDKPRGWRRGLVWHTQGSGKSLTMLFAARKMWFHPTLSQPTIFIIVDRDQLEDQISGQFFRTNTENSYVTTSRLDLLAKLREGFRGIIVTIMQKFQPGDFQVGRRNVVVLVDEAHRTQEGDLGTAMRFVLKEASLFGFTGTPIELGDHDTPRAFGRELSTDDTGVTRYERYLEPRYSIAELDSRWCNPTADVGTQPARLEALGQGVRREVRRGICPFA